MRERVYSEKFINILYFLRIMGPQKIFVLGTIGSGKSTFSKKLSLILKIKHYDLDDIFWTNKFNKKRSEGARDGAVLNLYKIITPA